MAQGPQLISLSVFIKMNDDGTSTTESHLLVDGQRIEAPLLVLVGGDLGIALEAHTDNTAAMRSLISMAHSAEWRLSDKLTNTLITAITKLQSDLNPPELAPEEKRITGRLPELPEGVADGETVRLTTPSA